MGALFVSGVKAQETDVRCGPRADLVKLLKSQHQFPVAIGMVSDQMIMETFVSVDGSWTMFFTGTKATSCLIATGNNWAFNTKPLDDAKKGSSF